LYDAKFRPHEGKGLARNPARQKRGFGLGKVKGQKSAGTKEEFLQVPEKRKGECDLRKEK